MKKFAILFFALVYNLFAIAGNENFAAGARQAGVSNAGLVIPDLWSAQHNQAGLALLQKPTAGLFYQSRFMLADLGLRCGAFALPVKKTGTFSLYVSDYGSKNYKEQKVGFAYAKSFGKMVHFGLQLDYLNTRLAEDYGKRSAFTAEAGVIVKLTGALELGAHIYNPTRAKLSEYNDERSPTIMKMGFGYRFGKKLLAVAETEKDINAKNSIKAGLEYDIAKQFVLRGGISSNPTLISFGFGIHLKQFRLDAAASMHQVLGYTPQVSLSYEFK